MISNLTCTQRGSGHKLQQRRCITKKRQSSLGLSDHFPGLGILNYRSDRDWSLRVLFWRAFVKIDVVGTMSTPITDQLVRPKIGLLL